ATFVDVEVGGARTDDGLPWLRQRLDRKDVRGGPVEDGKRPRGGAEMLAKPLQSTGRPRVTAIRSGMAVVGGADRLQHLGVYAGVIVAGKAGSFGHPFGISSFKALECGFDSVTMGKLTPRHD